MTGNLPTAFEDNLFFKAFCSRLDNEGYSISPPIFSIRIEDGELTQGHNLRRFSLAKKGETIGSVIVHAKGPEGITVYHEATLEDVVASMDREGLL